jgi:hypothetical protein
MRIELDEATHAYRVDGARWPGVTEILRPLTSFEGIPPDVLARKADLGRRVHFACQLDDEDDLDESSVEPDVAPYLEAWRRFLRESGARVVYNEMRVANMIHGYAGTLDNVLEIGGARWLVDKKTAIATPRAAGPQTAAYLRALAAPHVTRPDITLRAVVRLRPDGTFRFDPRNDPNDWSTFLACLTLYRFNESNPP